MKIWKENNFPKTKNILYSRKSFLRTRKMRFWQPCHGVSAKLFNFFPSNCSNNSKKPKCFEHNNKLFSTWTFNSARKSQCWHCFQFFLRNSDWILFQNPKLMKVCMFLWNNLFPWKFSSKNIEWIWNNIGERSSPIVELFFTLVIRRME